MQSAANAQCNPGIVSASCRTPAQRFLQVQWLPHSRRPLRLRSLQSCGSHGGDDVPQCSGVSGDTGLCQPRRRDALAVLLSAWCFALSPGGSLAADGGAGDDEGDTAAAEAQMKEVLAKQPAISGFTQLQATLCGRQLTFEIPASWTAGPSSSGTDGDGFEFTSWGGLTDPVLGVIAVEVTLRAKRVPGEVVRRSLRSSPAIHLSTCEHV